LRELVAARDALEARNAVCITLGQVSVKAHEYAEQNRITLISDADLVALTAETIKIL
jgi:restriction system protein